MVNNPELHLKHFYNIPNDWNNFKAMSPFNKSVYLNKLRVDKDDNGSCQFQPKCEGTRASESNR